MSNTNKLVNNMFATTNHDYDMPITEAKPSKGVGYTTEYPLPLANDGDILSIMQMAKMSRNLFDRASKAFSIDPTPDNERALIETGEDHKRAFGKLAKLRNMAHEMNASY